jgi:uncharacterized protein (DUF305 family)
MVRAITCARGSSKQAERTSDMKNKLAISAAAIAVIGSVAIAQTGDMAMKEYMAAHEQMMKEMMKPMSGDPDKDFVMMMIPHHRGAIDMANVEIKYGKDPVLVALAKKIIEAQKPEIEAMEEWQSLHGK